MNRTITHEDVNVERVGMSDPNFVNEGQGYHLCATYAADFGDIQSAQSWIDPETGKCATGY